MDTVGSSMPSIEFSGIASNTGIYVGIILLVGIIIAIIIGFLLYFTTYNKKVVFFENISGNGYQPILKTRARILKLGVGGEELLKTQKGGYLLTAYGRKMGKNTYWFAKGQDGYYYNFLLTDLDQKRGMLDIEPIDRDVRLFHVALDRIAYSTYGKQNFLEKYGIHLMLFIFLIVLIGGIWFIVGQIGDAVAPLGQATSKALEIQQINLEITNKLSIITQSLAQQGIQTGVNETIPPLINGSGLVPAT